MKQSDIIQTQNMSSNNVNISSPPSDSDIDDVLFDLQFAQRLMSRPKVNIELVKHIIRDATTKCSGLKKEHDAALAARDAADTERNTAKEQYDVLEEEHARLSQRYNALKEQHEGQGPNIKVQDTDMDLRCENLTPQCEQLRQELDVAIQGRDAALKENEALKRKLDHVARRAASAERARDIARANLESICRENDWEARRPRSLRSSPVPSRGRGGRRIYRRHAAWERFHTARRSQSPHSRGSREPSLSYEPDA
ncbi:hypothetical protein QBC32DRAFT_382162 [Pseudoneurospora amorphoporcata]|uniref:Uncharacterized protein n=1 Tax=Pseudoneurospora amorphoporcata TaxID=241081 RepID=A0AAN6NLJ1_9PEZI|nr:hypothetical protein QBC32DRAFT_382162 [Pseudoneurospora amorphoporcata]